MECILSFFTKYRDALITITWVVAALGWIVTNRQSNTREKRKETRAEVDVICKAAAEILVACRAYYADGPGSENDDTRSAQIAFDVKRVLSRTQRLSRKVKAFESAVPAGDEFFEAVTQEPFQSKSREKFGPRSEVLTRVEGSVHNLIDKLEEGFTKAFS